MNNFLLMLGALLVGILAALVAVPMLVDWNSYRGVFEEEASRLMGRDVRVGGAVNLRILPIPYVRFEKLRIADTLSTGGDPLFRADSVTMQLSIAPLLRGVLEAKSVELKRPSLRLAVDADGRGNWRSLALTPGSLPFVPADVALQSVGIEDGTLVLAGPTAKNLAELSDISGELSADGFEGPFKFKGTANWDGEARDIRVATSKPEPEGATHLRAVVSAPSTRNAYTFDGRVLDLKGRPRVEGELTAKLKAPNSGNTAAKPATGADDDGFDLKATVGADLKGGTFTGITLSRDEPTDPQLVTGSAKADWGDALRFDMELASRSFNLDRLASGTAPSGPLETARNALAVVLAALPAEAETDASLKAERVTLGGEALTGVTLAMNRRGSTLEVHTLKALLPGNTRLQASGTLTKDAKQPAFNGPVSLRGGNLARFLAWSRKPAPDSPAAGGSAPADAAPIARYEGPFALEGQLVMTAGRLELTRALAELTGQSVAGELRINTEGRHRIGIVLEGERIDAAQIWPGGFDTVRLRALVTGPANAASPAGAASPPGGSSSAKASPGLYGLDPETTDVNVEVRASELQLTASTNLHDVDTAFAVERGQLNLPRLRFTTDAGLSVDIDGELAGFANPASTQPVAATIGTPQKRRGTLRWVVDAATPQATAELINAIDWPPGARPPDATIAAFSALGPMHLAGATELGSHGPQSLDLTLDGAIDGGRVTGRARLDSGLAAWASAPLDVSASIETAGVDRWLTMAGLGPMNDGRAGSARPGRLIVQAEGPPRAGLTALVSLASERLSAVYQGLAATPRDGEITLEGTTAIAARDATEALGLAGVSLGQGPSALSFTGNVGVSLAAGALTLVTADAKLGSSGFKGNVLLRRPPASSDSVKPAPRELSATLALDAATLPGLLSALSDRRQPASDQTRWPDQPLKLSEALTGRAGLAVAQLGIDGAMSVRNFVTDIRLSPGSVVLDGFSATGLDGKITGKLAFKSAPAGVAFNGDLALTDANLSALTQGAWGPLAVSASLKGQGLSASGLIASLSGSGEAALGAGQIKGVAPGAVASTIDGALASKEPLAGDDLSRTIRLSLAASSLAFEPRKLPFTLANGVARVPLSAFPAREGRATFESSLDLNALRFATDWRIEAAAKPSPAGTLKPPLPAVMMSQSDVLANIAASEGKITLGAFEQELVVRKMEHDSEELERLRKLDEERRLQEDADRQKAAAAAAAAAALAAGANAQPPTPGAQPGEPGNTSGTAPATAIVPQSGASTDTANPPPPAATPPGPAAPASSPSPPTPKPANADGAPRRSPQTGATARRRDDGIPRPFSNNF